MKKLFLLALFCWAILAPFGTTQAKLRPVEGIIYSDTDDSFFVPSYDQYGRCFMFATVQVRVIPTTNGGHRVIARMTGYRYDEDEYFPVEEGIFDCDGLICHYKLVQWNVTSYFNIMEDE